MKDKKRSGEWTRASAVSVAGNFSERDLGGISATATLGWLMSNLVQGRFDNSPPPSC